MGMDSRASNISTSSGNSDALEPLLTLALGASEEVNTTAALSKDKSDKNSYMLRSKSSKTKERNMEVSSQEVFQTTPLNTPIGNNPPTESCHQSTSSKEDETTECVDPVSDNEITQVILPEHINLVQVQTFSEPISNGNTEGTETTSLPPGLVMIEQSVLEQISGILKNAASAVTNDNISKIITNTATPSVQMTSSLQDQQTSIQSSADGSTSETNVTHQPLLTSDDDEWIDTKATASQLTDELRRYHIPQAVFAKKVLNRSQGTLSDILRKPKPWNEMRLGKEIFRKMKEWLSLPEVKRIPQLRMEAAKDLESRSKRHISDDIMGSGSKKVRRQFTETQKRALFAIFKETKKPTKEMQKALAEELELDLNTVSNFFMNARRRYASE